VACKDDKQNYEDSFPYLKKKVLSLSLKRQSVLIQTKQWYISSLASRKSIRELEGEK